MIIEGIDRPENKQKIALVAVGFNRLAGIRRLLESLAQADYGGDDVPLVISIDCSGDEALYDYVRSFEWKHGTKYVNIQESRLGLRDHILQCGDLSRYFKAITLFEDDIWASPAFYTYITQAVARFGDDEHICQIALYRNEWLGSNGFYFEPLHDGTDGFLWTDICTWGECWTSAMWSSFREWLEAHGEAYVDQTDIPDYVKQWKKAWSKLFIAYAADTRKYALFPYESLTTNFNDAGGEHSGGNNSFQASVAVGPRSYRFAPSGKMVSYDVYANNEMLFDWLPESFHGQVCLDLYGIRSDYQGKRYVLSLRNLPNKTVEEWGLKMRPVELNILYQVPGEGIRLYDTTQPARRRAGRFNAYTEPTGSYYLRDFNPYLALRFAIRRIKETVRRRLGRR